MVPGRGGGKELVYDTFRRPRSPATFSEFLEPLGPEAHPYLGQSNCKFSPIRIGLYPLRVQITGDDPGLLERDAKTTLLTILREKGRLKNHKSLSTAICFPSFSRNFFGTYGSREFVSLQGLGLPFSSLIYQRFITTVSEARRDPRQLKTRRDRAIQRLFWLLAPVRPK